MHFFAMKNNSLASNAEWMIIESPETLVIV